MNSISHSRATHLAPRFLHVHQGTFEVSDDPGISLVTVLGSCVACCLFDPDAGVGGMNHFLLPSAKDGPGAGIRYGANAMEMLLNGLFKRGAAKSRLRAKLFGGARMRSGLGDVGANNAVFARQFLIDEGIICLAESLGGHQARKLRFIPTTGQAQQMLLAEWGTTDLEDPAPPPPSPAGDMTLFED